MADLRHVTPNRLTIVARRERNQSRLIILAISIPASLLVAALIHPLAGLASLTLALFMVTTLQLDPTIQAGAKGEDIALRLLQKLPDYYTLINQLDLPNARSRSGHTEADLIVAGPDCLFVIEVKHNHGRIDCDENRLEWQISNTGRKGIAYDKSMRNPVAQVKQQVWLLADYLKLRRTRTWIQPIVLFTHPAAELINYETTQVPLLKPDQLLAYLLSYQPINPRPVSAQVISALVALKQGEPIIEHPLPVTA